VIFPPFTALARVQRCARGQRVGLGAQTMHEEDSGAFTGEISP
jgi:triosephosphate isomerase